MIKLLMFLTFMSISDIAYPQGSMSLYGRVIMVEKSILGYSDVSIDSRSIRVYSIEYDELLRFVGKCVVYTRLGRQEAIEAIACPS